LTVIVQTHDQYSSNPHVKFLGSAYAVGFGISRLAIGTTARCGHNSCHNDTNSA